MHRIGRFRLQDISVDRLFSAIKVRLVDIPHIMNWLLLPSARRNRDLIRNYKNSHSGERCFIVANGPSLAKTNLELLSNEVTFGLNRIYLNFSVSTFRPTYYVAVNELVLEQFAGEIQNLSMPKFLSWNSRSNFPKPNSSIVFLKPKMVLHDFFQEDLTKPIVFGGTVTFVALQIAFYMGFKQVILIGLDHDFKDKGTPNKVEMRLSENDENHFHPQYFPKGIKWQLPDILRSELVYATACDVFQKNGREILDATPDGKCKVFPKANYLSLF